MDPLRSICEIDGYFTRGQARDVGYDDKAVSLMVRSGIWQRFRRGYFCFTDIWSVLDDVERHLVRARAVMHSLRDAVALSHVSGALVHGITTWGVSLDRVHVTRLDGGAGRVEGDVVHHVGRCIDSDLTEVAGLRTMTAARCAVECASTASAESALVTFDSLLHRGLAEPDGLRRQFEAMSSWPRVRHLHVPVRMADGRADGAGESRGRWHFWTIGLPAPELQYDVFDSDGVLRGTCDWAWPAHRALGEFDGQVKYGRLLKTDQEPGNVVFAEKRREDELRELTGFTMIRLVWSDYERPRVTAARLRKVLGLAG